jgi:hypothetical protein
VRGSVVHPEAIEPCVQLGSQGRWVDSQSLWQEAAVGR